MPRPKSTTTLPSVTNRVRNGRRSYRVRWHHIGRECSRQFTTKKEAERLATTIRRAIEDGTPFNPATGLPVQREASPEQLSAYAQQWLASRWPTWKPRTRTSELEAVVRIVLYTVRPDAEPAPEGIRTYLAQTLRPAAAQGDESALSASVTRHSASEHDCRRWVESSSLALSEVTPAVAERVALALGRLLDGKTPAATTTARRYRTTLRALLRDAFEDGHLTDDPWTRKVAKAARASVDLTVNTAVLPDHADARRVIDGIRSHHPASENYRMLSLILFHLGLRPSEALALRWEDLALPEQGWGSVVIVRATDGAGGFGSTKTNRIRHVPVPQVLVAELRAFADGVTTGQLFKTRTGRTPTLSNWNRSVKRACRAAGVPPMRLYDFRHLHATFLLNLGLAPAEIASRLGHSVDVLLRVYAGVMNGDRERANATIERALEASATVPLRVVA